MYESSRLGFHSGGNVRSKSVRVRHCRGLSFRFLYIVLQTYVKLFVCNVNLRKLISARKSHVRETSLSPAPYQIKFAIAKLFVSFWCQVKIWEGQSQGDSEKLRLQSATMADVWLRNVKEWKKFGLQS